jgi:hypothetical protein
MKNKTRVSTQLQLNISYRIISYHIISYIISYHIYHITSHHVISYHIISYHIIYHIISHFSFFKVTNAGYLLRYSCVLICLNICRTQRMVVMTYLEGHNGKTNFNYSTMCERYINKTKIRFIQMVTY